MNVLIILGEGFDANFKLQPVLFSSLYTFSPEAVPPLIY